MKSIRIEFEKLNNTRDLGGLYTKDGRKIKNGVLFRSGRLSVSSDNDLRKLKNLNIRQVIDMRSEAEIREAPNPKMPWASYQWLPMVEDAMAGITRDADSNASFSRTLLKNIRNDRKYGRRYMTNLYESLVREEHSQRQYGRFLRLLADAEIPVLWHCTGGKDRAGLATVFLLEILGVDRNEIIKDYLATNEYLESTMLKRFRYIRFLLPWVYDNYSEGVTDVMGARQEYIDAAYAVMERVYGSVERFMAEALGADEELRSRLRAKFLE